jgi:hypothetical protein
VRKSCGPGAMIVAEEAASPKISFPVMGDADDDDSVFVVPRAADVRGSCCCGGAAGWCDDDDDDDDGVPFMFDALRARMVEQRRQQNEPSGALA